MDTLQQISDLTAENARLRKALEELAAWVEECNFEGEFDQDDILRPARAALSKTAP